METEGGGGRQNLEAGQNEMVNGRRWTVQVPGSPLTAVARLPNPCPSNTSQNFYQILEISSLDHLQQFSVPRGRRDLTEDDDTVS